MRLRGSKGPYSLHEGKHLILMSQLYAYADESGIEDTAEYCLVVGYIASRRQWTAFNRDWKQALKGAPNVSKFHAKYFFQAESRQSSKNPHRHLNGKQARAFLDELLSIIVRHKVYPIGGAIDAKAFRELDHDSRRYLTGGRTGTRVRHTESDYKINDRALSTGKPSQPYYTCLYGLIVDALKASQEAHNAKVHFVLDIQKQLEPWALIAYRELKQYDTDAHPNVGDLGELAYDASVNRPGLQAADLYGYMLNSWLNGNMNDALDRVYNALMKKQPGIAVLRKNQLEGIVEMGSQDRLHFIERELRWREERT